MSNEHVIADYMKQYIKITCAVAPTGLEINRNLEISKSTVISELKKTPTEVNPYFLPDTDIFSDPETEIRPDTETDEFRSYAGNKGNQRRTRYASVRKSGIIPAWHNGRRTDESYACLMDKLSIFPIKYYRYRQQRSNRIFSGG